jgi:hypothetical protein
MADRSGEIKETGCKILSSVQMRKRPLLVTLISCLFIAAGSMGIIYHAAELKEILTDTAVIGIFIVRLMAIIGGVFAWRGDQLGSMAVGDVDFLPRSHQFFSHTGRTGHTPRCNGYYNTCLILFKKQCLFWKEEKWPD